MILLRHTDRDRSHDAAGFPVQTLGAGAVCPLVGRRMAHYSDVSGRCDDGTLYRGGVRIIVNAPRYNF